MLLVTLFKSDENDKCDDSIFKNTVTYSKLRYGTVRYGSVRYGSLRFATVRYGTVEILYG